MEDTLSHNDNVNEPAHIVILGAGTGGTLVANRLQRTLGERATITVVDQDNRHVYQPGLLFVPFGMNDVEDLVRSRRRQLHETIQCHISGVQWVDIKNNVVYLEDASELLYDVLIIATGAQLLPEETPGLTGAGWMTKMFTFYTPDGAVALEKELQQFESGRLVVNIVDMPIKCPVAPLEFCFLADWYLRERGVRDEVELTFVTPLDGAFTKPVASRELDTLLASKDIHLETDFVTGEVDGPGGRLISYDEREVPFDLLVAIPVHGGADYVSQSPGLGDALNFIPCDHETLQSNAAPNVFVVGDATNIPTSKAGSVTHFEGEILVENVRHFLAGEPLAASFDGHANCFIETGFHKALLIDFNYDNEPLRGHFPHPRFGPLPLLAESRLNHMAKLAFQPLYWHMLLPGRDLPGIESHMRQPRELLHATTGDER